MGNILIIGGGLAGWRAAEAAIIGGANVTIVANGTGNSPYVHALCCPVLPEDSIEKYVQDTMSSGKFGNDPALVEIMCRKSLLLRDEFAFDGTIIRSLGSSIPRCVSIRHAIGEIALENIKKKTERKSKG